MANGRMRDRMSGEVRGRNAPLLLDDSSDDVLAQ